MKLSYKNYWDFNTLRPASQGVLTFRRGKGKLLLLSLYVSGAGLCRTGSAKQNTY